VVSVILASLELLLSLLDDLISTLPTSQPAGGYGSAHPPFTPLSWSRQHDFATEKALALGIEPKAIEHVALLACPTIGFPNMMTARGWVRDVLTEE
jgi:hypothetical protein